MHTYTPLLDVGQLGPPIADYRFHDALDVVEYARSNRHIGWQTWPEVWHLDDDGAMQCCARCSTLDGIRRWVEDPYSLYASRYEGDVAGPCPDRWVIVESRVLEESPVMHEGDAAAYVAVRDRLRDDLGVDLLDAVIFDDRCHWWSMHELTTARCSGHPRRLQGEHGERLVSCCGGTRR